jgi:hypothetical protein
MIVATKILKPGPVRVARIAPGITLPRSVPLVKGIVALAFGLGGIIIAAALPPTRSLSAIVVAAVLSGALGVLVATYSPLKGESMARWAGLELTSRRNRLRINGELARVYVGICPVAELPRGKVRIRAGAVDVPTGSVDERGLPSKRIAPVLSRLGPRADRPTTAPQPVPVALEHLEPAQPRATRQRRGPTLRP